MTVKICHVTSAHSTSDVRILKKECASLAKREEYKVFLVGPGEDAEYEKVNIIGVGYLPKSRMQRMTKFAKATIEVAVKLNADVYHFHDPELLRFAVKLKKLGKKVIFDSHENILDSIDEKAYMPVIIRKIFKLYYKSLQSKVLPQIDGIIVVSPQMVDTYKKYNDNIALVTNYPIVQKKLGNEQNREVVKGRFIFAGGISEQWSHREIINAIENIDGVEYYLFGSADDEYLNELTKLNGWGKVHYEGKVSYERVQNELKKAQFAFALLKPGKNTFYEQGTLGNTKLFEAMENETPVIATNFELWVPIVEENQCGICVDPNNEKSIEIAIRKMLELSEENYSSMCARCKRIILENYSWTTMEKALDIFYRKVILEE